MATSGGSVPFAIDGSSMSPVNDAVSGIGLSPLTEVLLIASVLALVLVGIAGVLSHLYDAEAQIDNEIRELVAERDAYRAFAEAIDGIPAGASARAMATPQTVQTVDTSGPSVAHVRRAFEETIREVDHYEEAYGESWDEHLGNEFDDELITGLRRSGQVSQPIKRVLEQGALEAASKRDELLQVLSTEQSAVGEATDSLEAVESKLVSMNEVPLHDRSFEELQSIHSTFDTLSDRNEQVASCRQRQIHREIRCGFLDSPDMTLQEYLYEPIPVTYPVLDSATSLSAALQQARRRLRAAMTATV